MRTIVDFHKKQVCALDAVSHAKKVSRAEIVREAVDLWLEKNALKKEDEAFGAWKNRKIDAQKHIARLRAEWKR